MVLLWFGNTLRVVFGHGFGAGFGAPLDGFGGGFRMVWACLDVLGAIQ